MKKLTYIEALLTILVVLPFIIIGRLAILEAQHAGKANEPLPHLMEHPVFAVITDILYFSWLIFTPFYLLILFIYLGSVFFKKLTDENNSKM